MITEKEKRISQVQCTDKQVVRTCSVNDCFRQGDLQIIYLGENRPELNLSRHDNFDGQLAPGTTKGSRHMLVSQGNVFLLNNANPLEGPVIETEEGICVEHPEHGDVEIKEPGWYAITYQRAFADELRRVAD